MRSLKLLTVCFCFAILTSYAAEVRVISRPSAQERIPFIRQNLVKIFTLRTRYWPSGEPLQVFVLPKDSLYTQIFVRNYLSMTPQSYFDALSSAQASGRGSIPIELNTSAELVYRVMNTPDSIGYADENLLINANGRLLVVSPNSLAR